MTWNKARNAYLRRHGQLRPSHAADDLEVPHGATPPAVKVTTRPTSGSSEKSFGQRRKEMLLLRAGRRPVREVEVTVGAVAFAAKLRRQASAGSDPGGAAARSPRRRRTTSRSSPTTETARRSEDPSSASARHRRWWVPSPCRQELAESSLQKRKGVCSRARAAAQAEVALTAVAFAAKLKAARRNLLEEAAAAGRGRPQRRGGGAPAAPAEAPRWRRRRRRRRRRGRRSLTKSFAETEEMYLKPWRKPAPPGSCPRRRVRRRRQSRSSTSPPRRTKRCGHRHQRVTPRVIEYILYELC